MAIVRVNGSLSFHAEKQKNNFLVSGEAPTDGTNSSSGTTGKKNSINFSKKIVLTLVKQIQNVCLSLHYSGDDS